MEITTDQLLTVRDVSEKLGIHLNTVYKLVNSGAIRSVKLGPRLTRIRSTELNRYLTEGQGNAEDTNN